MSKIDTDSSSMIESELSTDSASIVPSASVSSNDDVSASSVNSDATEPDGFLNAAPNVFASSSCKIAVFVNLIFG